MLRLNNVSKTFDGKPALNSLSLDIAEGEFVVLVGPAACGKSTLLRLLSGLENVSEGDIWLQEENITFLSPRERNFAMIFQNYALFPHLSVRDNITFGMKIRKEDKASWQPRLEQVSRMLQLEPLLDRKPAKLSGGQREGGGEGLPEAMNCPAVSGSVWRWRVPLCAIRDFFSWTNRFPTLTRACVARFAIALWRCINSSGPAPSTLRTIKPKPCRWPIVSS